MYDVEETNVMDVDFAKLVIGSFSKRILKIGCESGRFLVPLAKTGHKVLGLDFDAFMLKKIDAKLDWGEHIQWIKLDFVKDEWETASVDNNCM